MSLLTVNGIAVPVATDSSRMGARIQGADVTADDGSLHRARSAYLDVMQGVTRLLSPTEALEWRGLLEGRGHRVAFDTDPAYSGTNPSAGADQYTSRGTYLAGLLSRLNGHAHTGYTTAGTARTLPAEAVFGQCIGTDGGTENLFPERVRRGGDLGSGTSSAGFVAGGGGGTVAVDTTTWVEGAASVSFVSGSAGVHYMEVDAAYRATPADSACHVLSFYAKAAANVSVTVTVRDNAGGLTTATVALTSTWQRFSIGHMPGVGATSMWLRWLPAATTKIYVDAVQAESGDAATPWVGASASATETRGLGSASATLTDFRAQDDLTLMGWFALPWNLDANTGFTSNMPLLSFGTATGAEGLVLRHNGATGALELRLVSAAYAQTTAVSYSTGINDRSWHHVAVVLRRAPTTGVYKATLFVDGASVGTPSSALAIPSWGTAPVLFVGREFAGVSRAFCMVDELVALPFALTAESIAAVYAARFSDLPRLNVAGDYFGATIECLGTVTGDGLRFGLAKDAVAGIQSRNAVIAFTLSQAVR